MRFHRIIRSGALTALLCSLAACGGSDDAAPVAATPTRTNTATYSAAPTATTTATSTSIPSATPSPSASPAATASPTATSTPFDPVDIIAPVDQQLSLAGDIPIVIYVGDVQILDACFEVTAKVDGVAIPLTQVGNKMYGTATAVAVGQHQLTVGFNNCQVIEQQVTFETIALDRPNECEVLNDAECLLPFPSSRFLEPAATATGYRVKLPQGGMPAQNGRPVPVGPYNLNDGFSPTVQILMHFVGGVDVERSDAPRLHPDTRTSDSRSLEADSPTVLIDAASGEHILHFVENDVRAQDPARRTLFLRPGRSLTPGHRYIVAVRRLMHEDGTPVIAEASFAALRDNRPSDIGAIESRRASFADIFTRLAAAGVARNDLQLAFDFTISSDESLTGQMLSMRDQAFAWLAEMASSQTKTFTVDKVTENDCTQAGTQAWRVIEGSYEVPLFLKGDPVINAAAPALLNVDSSFNPVANGVTRPPYTIAIPCSALANGGTPTLPVILGHGLFGDGRGFVEAIADAAAGDFTLIAGATDWRGLAGPDLAGDDLTRTFVGRVILQLQNFPAMPDRLRQGQLNTLVLARMMHNGTFHLDDAFKLPSGVGAFAGPDHEELYLGGSLGGIMGLMFAALSPDVVNVDVVVPAMNFSLLLQRATPFLAFETVFELGGITDPMQQALLLGILHELWVRGESAGYSTHITSNPLPATNAKNVLMTSAFLDQEVSNQGTEIAARTLGLPSLIGSLQSGLAQIPDQPGPLRSALVMYDVGAFDLNNPAHQPFIPPLSNLQAEPNRCDPHGHQAEIPAARRQIAAFLRPGGQVENFCNGICDGNGPDELPNGATMRCEPLDAPTPTATPG